MKHSEVCEEYNDSQVSSELPFKCMCPPGWGWKIKNEEPDVVQALRHNKGKPQLTYVLSAPAACVQIATVMEVGRQKYELDNWKKGFDKKEGLDSVLRHIMAHLNGHVYDPETELRHLSLALAGLLMYVDNEVLDRNHD